MSYRRIVPGSEGPRKRRALLSEQGFTVVELMIAALVFSVVLLVLTAGMLQIGRVFYKGLISARTQEAARRIVDNVGQTIQFAGGNIVDSSTSTMDNGDAINGSPVKGVCIGSRRYSYVLSQELTGTGVHPHRLVSDTITGGCSSGPGGTKARLASQFDDPLSNASEELLGTRMRLAQFSVTQSSPGSNLYNITVRVVYGDDDLLCSPSVPGDCSSTSTSTSLNNSDITCKGQAGSQYCAVSEIATTALKRLK